MQKERATFLWYASPAKKVRVKNSRERRCRFRRSDDKVERVSETIHEKDES